ncbi:MAG: DUF5119 domain-containing protein [Bacteroidales bacterium]|nr:DUF5119 domain-containing protein [Bacteroidales bacterium]
MCIKRKTFAAGIVSWIWVSAVLLQMTTLISCSSDHLYYETSNRCAVQLNIDWSNTAFSPENRGYDTRNTLNGVTVFAFDSLSHMMVKEFPPDANWKTPRILLEPGIYDLIVINDSRDELPSIRFDTTLPFDQCCAYIEGDTVFTNHPEYMTSATVRNVKVCKPESKYWYDRPDDYYNDVTLKEVDVVEYPVTKKINVKVIVNGINYCKGVLTSYISGMSQSARLADRKAGREETVYAFNLVSDRMAEDTPTSATLSKSFNTFGFNVENLKDGTEYHVQLNFMLVDNKPYSVTTDVTQQVKEWYEEHSIDMSLNLDINLDIVVDLPPTIPEDSNTGGFAPDTDPWDDIKQDISL